MADSSRVSEQAGADNGVCVLVLMHSSDRPGSVFADELVEHLTPRHRVSFLNARLPLVDQVRGTSVVVDIGGRAGVLESLGAVRQLGLELVQVMGTGTNHIDVERLAAAGVNVANCPGETGAVSVAEHAFMLMLMLARRSPLWTRAFDEIGWGRPFGAEVSGRTLGLIGFGASAKALAVRATAFDMRVVAVSGHSLSPEAARMHGAEHVGPMGELDEMLPKCDVVSLHLPLMPSTRHVMDRRRISLLTRGAHLVNVARGALVDEVALLQALRTGALDGAALDVFGDEPLAADSELRCADHVVLSPHIAGQTRETAYRRARVVAENCDRIAEGRDPLFLVH